MKKVLNNPAICPIQGLQKYVEGARALNIDLTSGYLFRCLDSSRKVVLDEPVSSTAMLDRLKFYLNELGLNEGETLHGIRGACAITLASTGAADSASKIMNHVGWFSEKSCDHYSRVSKMVDTESVANLFSRVADDDTHRVADIYSKLGDVNSFSKAF